VVTMETPINIRLANDEDFATIYEIWLDGIENSFNPNSIDGETLHQRFKRNFQARQGIFNYWIVEADRRLLGWQSLIKSAHNPFREDNWAESSTYIAKDNRVKGIGEALIKHAIREAEKSQLEYIVGYVAVDNIGARKITQRNGWIEVGEIPPSKKYKNGKRKLLLIRPV